jgi:outer membrane protein OmpA-like peptidoglycan-associated protein
MKTSKLIAAFAGASLVTAGVVAIAPAFASSHTHVARAPQITGLSYTPVVPDLGVPSTYTTDASALVSAGSYDTAVYLHYRIVGQTDENVAPTDPAVIAAESFEPGAPSNVLVTVTASLDELAPCTDYEFKFHAEQGLSLITSPADVVLVPGSSEPDRSPDGDTDGDHSSNAYDNDFDQNPVDLQTVDSDWMAVPKTPGSCGSPSPTPTPPAPPAPPVVEVTPTPTATPTPTPTPTVPPVIEPEFVNSRAAASVYFGGDSAVLSKDSLNRIASLYSKIPDNATNIEIIFRGFVSPTVVTNYDRKLAAARVAAVKKQLLKRGIVAQITIPTLAVDKKSTPTKARRVDIVVTYDLPVSTN